MLNILISKKPESQNVNPHYPRQISPQGYSWYIFINVFKKTFLSLFCITILVCPLCAQEDDIADVPSQRKNLDDDSNKTYFVIGPYENQKIPDGGFALVIIMPGGDGSEDFLPFVKRIYKYALTGDYIAVQPIAPKWSPQQQIVWPTALGKEKGMKFTTEQFVEQLIAKVGSEYKINPEKVFTLSWSSSGPAAYAISMQEKTAVQGSYIAMSVFKPSGNMLSNAKGRSYFIDHSPQDKVCPFAMAKRAEKVLTESQAIVRLNTYEGGHGWQGNVYERIREGFAWLQRQEEKTPSDLPGKRQTAEPNKIAEQNPSYRKVLLDEDFEKPGAWSKGAPVPGVEYIWDKSQGYSGGASLCLKKTEDRYFPIAQWQKTLPVKGDIKQLEVKAMVKARAMTKSVIDVQFKGAGKESGHQWAVYIGAKEENDKPADHDWKEYSGKVDIPAGTKGVTIALQIYGPGTVWFDAIKITGD